MIEGSTDDALTYRRLVLAEVRAAAPIPSGYVTDSRLRLNQVERESTRTWSLSEELLPRRFEKVYDDGAVDEWIASYSEAISLDSFRFAGALLGECLVGLAAWVSQEWNSSVWLVDIRVRGDSRRRGIGGRLIEFVKDDARRMGARGIRVETQTTNVPAIRFYLAHGFRITGFDDHLYSNRDLDEQEVGLFLFWERPHTRATPSAAQLSC